MIWSRERKGIFTVKSTYRLAYSFRKEVVAKAESSRGKDKHRSMWKQV